MLQNAERKTKGRAKYNFFYLKFDSGLNLHINSRVSIALDDSRCADLGASSNCSFFLKRDWDLLMGAPKHKWTAEEEATLKAGIAKYGAGKWSKILKDPEFCDVLRMRSNVDLKDKWRNIHVAESGFGSRQKSRFADKNIQPTPNHDNNSLALSITVVDGDIEIADAKPLGIISDSLPNGGPKKPISRLDDHILESITNLKEPRGSSRTAIAMKIKEKYLAPPNLERLLSTNLKLLTDNGKLTKVKHQYRIAPSSPTLDVKNGPSSLLDGKKDLPGAETSGIKLLPKADIVEHQYRIAPASPSLHVKMDTLSLLLDVERDAFSLLLHEKKDPSALALNGKDPPKAVMNGIKVLTKADIDAELKKMMSMSAEEAAAAAEQAVAEAEAAIAMAEEAAREAEEAERDAEAAKGFLEETKKKSLKCRKLRS